tara:strand:+ start:258 stop:884 length:627 start_codon:yes stop_codon:yes gene_type:complete
MSSREIAELTGSRHDSVRKSARRLEANGLLTSPLAESAFRTSSGSHQEFHFNKRDSLVLVARLSPEFTAAVIDRWQELEAQQAPQIPQTYAAALLEAGRLAQIVDDQNNKLQIAAPKVEFHDTVVNSTNTFSTRDAAKKINQRPIKFGEWLKGNGYLCMNGRAAQKYIDQRLFVTHTGVSESEHEYTQTRMTSKGCAYFANKLFDIKL